MGEANFWVRNDLDVDGTRYRLVSDMHDVESIRLINPPSSVVLDYPRAMIALDIDGAPGEWGTELHLGTIEPHQPPRRTVRQRMSAWFWRARVWIARRVLGLDKYDLR